MHYSSKQIHTRNKEYAEYYPQWELIRHVLMNKVDQYLRDVGASEIDSDYGKQRQKAYVDGAYFLNFTSTTVESQNGSLYTSEPDIKVDSIHPSMEYLVKDIDGSGVQLIQQVKDASFDAVSIGRGLLLTDMPFSDGDTSAADQQNGNSSPRIIYYPAESIVDWRTEMIGSTQKLVWLKLSERVTSQLYEFEIEEETQYRILALNSQGQYTQRVIVKNKDKNTTESNAYMDSTDYRATANIDELKENADQFGIVIRQAGNTLNYLPVFFIGSKNNDVSVDEPPVFTLASLNIAHFRNTADHEEELFVCSQVMLALYPDAKMDAKTWNEYNPQGIKFGSRQGITLPGGRAELLQAQAGGALEKAIQDKLEQAISIGAVLTQPASNVTATTARIQHSASVAILTNIAENVSDAYTKALQECAKFLGLDPTDVYLTIQKNFYLQVATPQEKAQWLAEVNTGIMPKSAYYSWLRNRGETDLTDQEIADELESEGMDNENLFSDSPTVPEPTITNSETVTEIIADDEVL